MKTCVVTCTGERPELFALCRKWVDRQTLQPDVWIVACDNDEETPDLPAFARLLRIQADMRALPPTVRAHRTLAYALGEVPPLHHAVIFEDDDWYPATYLEDMERALVADAPLAGCNTEYRYNLPARRWQILHQTWCNAGSTAINASKVWSIAQILHGGHGSDNLAWRVHGGVYINSHRVAIKGVGFGLPGRPGATIKHDPTCMKVQGWTPDDDLATFRELLGHDADDYLRLCTPQHDSSSGR